MCTIFRKAHVIRKLAYKVKYTSQINGGLIMFFFLNLRIRFFKISWLICEQNEKKNQFKKQKTKQKKHNQQFSVQSVTITFILFKCARSNGNSTDFHLFILL